MKESGLRVGIEGGRLRRAGAAVALAIAILLGGGGGGGRLAAAADSAEVEALIGEGITLRQQGRDEKALPLFQKAYQIVATPRTAGQLGFCQMAVGYWLEAEQHLNEALESPDHPWVVKNFTTIKKALERIRVNIGEIVIDGSPAGATVTVNHVPSGAFPLPGPLRVAKGKVDVEVSAPGYAMATRSFRIKGGDRQQVTVKLDRTVVSEPTPARVPESAPLAAPVAAPPAVPPVAGEVPKPPSSPPPLPPPAAAADGGSTFRRKLGWGLGAGAAAVLIGAVVETVLWQKKRSDYNGSAGCYSDVKDRGAPGCSALYDATERAKTIAVIGYVAAGALAGASAVLLLGGNTSESASRPAGSTLACAPTFAASGTSVVTCRWSF
jgi:hypothetical protein